MRTNISLRSARRLAVAGLLSLSVLAMGGCDGTEATPEALVPPPAEPPTFMLLVDQSGSMGSVFEVTVTRWDALSTALMDPGRGAVAQRQSSVRIGLTLFMDDASATCPDLAEVPPALDNLPDLSALYSSQAPGGATPTADAITAATAALLASPDPTILLINDGQPTDCAGQPALGDQGAITAATAAYSAGIQVVAIGLGPGVSPTFLHAVGYEGGGGTANFFAVNTMADLEFALASLLP